MLFLMFLPGVYSVCQVCWQDDHETAACPLNKDVAANVVVIGAATAAAAAALNIDKIVPAYLRRLFPYNVLKSLLLLNRRASSSGTFEFKDTTKPTEIVAAVRAGLLTKDDALAHVATWLDDDTKMTRVEPTTNMINAIGKSPNQCGAEAGTGCFRYVLARVSFFVMKMPGTTVFLDIAPESTAEPGTSSAGASVSSKMHLPTTMEEFSEMLNLFTMLCHAAGLANNLVMQQFLQDVVYRSMRVLGLSWQGAYEMLMVYLAEVEENPHLYNISNVFEKCGQDAKLRAAEQACKEHFGEGVFAPRSQSARGSGNPSVKKLPYNCPCKADATLPCFPFNRMQDHPDSCRDSPNRNQCKYLHVCNQKLSDGSLCRGDHPAKQCPNKPAGTSQ